MTTAPPAVAAGWNTGADAPAHLKRWLALVILSTTFSSLLISFGRLADVIGRRDLFFAGATLFAPADPAHASMPLQPETIS